MMFHALTDLPAKAPFPLAGWKFDRGLLPTGIERKVHV